jgi:hypothetical protein
METTTTTATTTETPEAFMAKPQAEHEWLHKLVGEWEYEMDAPEGSGLEKTTGTESVRSLGGLWVLLEGKGEMPGGGEGSTLMTLGYDPAKERYVGTWVGSMMHWVWNYEGKLEGNRLSFESIGPDFANPGQTQRYNDVIELTSDDERTLTGHVQAADGSWQPMMTARYRRKR